ncbi:zinc-dependent metalloprotease [Pedobacter sp. GR22-6]|uniref:zinc-dependent metalloprotease n=1 Tax=Pedobacter sp. GR22-6 TaxID=3127957 RepID=UPI00307FA948
MYKVNIALLALLGCALNLKAQDKPKQKTIEKTPAATTAPVKKTDTVPAAVKPYKEIITEKARTSKGMFKVHQIGQRYFFEIPDTLLKRDILVVNRISKSATGPRPQMTGYAGDEIAQNVINFEKGPEDRIFLKLISFNERSNDTTENGLYKSVLNSNLQPIVAVFPIKAYGGDSAKVRTSVIDVTDFINTENEILHFSSRIKTLLGVGAIQSDKSFINSIGTYPMNVEIRMLRTYGRGAIGGQPQATTLPVTYELNSSIVLLPKVPMKARFADARVGFFGQAYIDFDAAPQSVKQSVMMVRWRLEPKDADIEKYKRGELVEPKKPIIYYIDPATPKKWVPYLIAGVNDWQKAFEQAGFKNAIVAMPAPTNDPSWSIDDARHNVIVYKPSSVANASGPNVHDPRSGEIIETHINWYHNIMALVHNWYMIQASAVDPRARKMKFDDELMGQLIRFVSSHEVGHTLGLLHNFGSSSTVPVEKLRDKNWLEKNGHTPSIMDYARFNYVAQPEDGVTEKGLFPRIGDYDKWAIEFGYKWLPQFKDPLSEGPYLNKWIIDRMSKDKRLYFGNENEFSDPRSQSEDLGDDAMLASSYGIKNLKRIIPQLKDWTAEPGEGYGSLKMIYEEIFRQFQTYLGHVTRNVAGLYATPKSIEQKGSIFEYVPYDRQKEAMKFLKENVLYTPEWLLDQDIMSKTGTNGIMWIGIFQSQVLNRLQGADILNKLLTAETSKTQKSYQATEFLDDLKMGVWEELYTNKPIDIYRRNLQKTYILNAMKAFAATGEIVMTSQGSGLLVYVNPDPTRFDASSLTRAHLLSLRDDIQKAIPSQNGLSRFHLEDMVQRITEGLSSKLK